MKRDDKHKILIENWHQDAKFREAYEALEEEFSLFDAMITARQKAGLTQEEVAKRMGTQIPAVARLEASGGKKRHSPSIKTLQKYAKAVNCHLQIKFISNRKNKKN